MTTVRAEQHLFTAKGYRYETTAVSTGITKEIKSRLETCVGNYKSQNPQNPQDAERVFRGMRIPQGWAASTITDTEAAFERDNRVAHSFYFTPEAMAINRFNLPWVACHLPFHRDYKPNLSADLEQLDPIDLELEAERQYDLLVKVVAELGPALVRQSVEWMLKAFKHPQTLVWPAAAPEAAAEYGTFFRLDEPMRADQVQLARLGGVFALLPAAFIADLSYSLNESSKVKTLLAAPGRRDPAIEDAVERPWLTWCLEKAQAQDVSALSQSHGELSSLMPPGTTPSTEALDRVFSYWHHGRTAAIVTWEGVAEAIKPLIGHDVSVEAVYQRSAALLASSGGDRTSLLNALVSLSAGSQRALPASVADILLDLLPTLKPDTARENFIKGMPQQIQAQLWDESTTRGVFPSRLAADCADGDIRFLLSCFNLELPVRPATSDTVLLSLKSALERIASRHLDSRGIAQDPRIPLTLRGISLLGSSSVIEQSIQGRVLAHLAQAWAVTAQANAREVRRQQQNQYWALDLEPRHVSIEEELHYVLEKINAGQFASSAMAALVLELSRHDGIGAAAAVLRHIGDGYRPSTPSLVRRLNEWPVDGRHAIASLRELVDRVSSSRMTAEPPSFILAAFATWMRDPVIRDKPQFRLTVLFADCVTRLAEGLPSSSEAVTIGACYLRLFPAEHYVLARAVADRLRNLEDTIAERDSPLSGRPYYAALGDLLGATYRSGPRAIYSEVVNFVSRVAGRVGSDRAGRFVGDLQRYCQMTESAFPRELEGFLPRRPRGGFWS